MSYLKPTSLAAAASARAAHPNYTVICGGTDLMVRANEKAPLEGMIDVFDVPDMRGITREDGAIVIGASTPYATILASDEVRIGLPMLHEAVREIGALQIQERGTIGGNVGTSSPVGDTLPCLLALDAEIVLASETAGRTVAYREFCTGYRKTVVRKDEIIAAVRIPLPHSDCIQLWRKVGTRRAQSISKAMVAICARMDGSTFEEVRIGLGAVADRPIRAERIEQAMRGNRASDRLAEEVGHLARNEIHPIDDVRSTAAYRLAVTANMLASFARTPQPLDRGHVPTP